MFCHNCGNECPEGAAFCNKCGTKLVEENKAPAEETSAEENIETAPVAEEVSTPAVEATSESKPDVAPAPTPVVEPTPAPGAEQPKKKKANVGLIVGLSVGGTVLLLIILGAVLIFNFFQSIFNPNKNKPEEIKDKIEAVDQLPDEDSDAYGDDGSAIDDSEDTQDVEVVNSSVFLSNRELNDAERARQAAIQELALDESANSVGTFDLFADNTRPKSRDTSLKWDNKIFYSLELSERHDGYTSKYNCDIKRLSLVDKNGHDVEIEAYINPSNGVANKIVYIEYVNDGIKVRDFYYTNNEKANFVFDYKADNYVSSYATPDQSGSRYLFCKDTLVTYRKISGRKITNISVGSKESERMRTQFSSSQRKLLKNQSADVKADFNDRENKWLDAAYNVYDLVMNAETNTKISGYVYYADGETHAAGVHVGLFTNDFGALLYETVTDSDGYYQFIVPDNDYNYMVKVIYDNYYDECIYDVNAGNNQVNIYIDTVYLFANQDDGRVQLILGDAVNISSNGSGMKPLKNATVRFRRGFGNRTGDVLYTFKAGSDGIIDEKVAAGNYCIQIDCDGFTTMFYNIVVNPFISINRYECYATPTLRDGEVRIVLTWGEYPHDLDSHLFVGSESHTWYGNKNNAGNDLDVDDTSSYGPETVTIYNLDRRKYYKYCVCDFTNLSRSDAASSDMSFSDATVFVYDSTGLLAKYNVPYDTSGTIWEVFEIRNGQVNSIQRYFNNDSSRTWWHHN